MVEETTLNRKHYRYFIYSETQYKERVEIEKKIGRAYKPGTVVYKGKVKHYIYNNIMESILSSIVIGIAAILAIWAFIQSYKESPFHKNQ